MQTTTTALRSARTGCALSKLTALGLKEAEMRIIDCDLHTAKHTIAMLDCDTGEVRVTSAVAQPTPG